MTDLRWQKSCSLSDRELRVNSNGATIRVASIPIPYIISYCIISYFTITKMLCLITNTIYSFIDMRGSRFRSNS